MKKILVMSALVAFSTAFVACSNENDLVQQKPDVPEDMIEEGIPMKIIVSDLATRGTDFSSTNPLLAFKLYSTMLTPTEAALETPPATPSWSTGKLFSRDDGDSEWTTNGVLAWPDANEYTFYGINDFANITIVKDAESHDIPQIPTVSADPVTFSYTIPTDYAEQVDLLVSKNTGSSSSGNPAGSLTVNFNHALAQITGIKVYCNIDRVTNSEDKVNYRFRIKGIRLGGLQTVGTYTFGDAFANDTWNVPTSAVDEDTFFEIPLKTESLTFSSMSFGPTKKTDKPDDYAITLPLNTTTEGLYLIPQTAAGSLSFVSPLYYVNGAYAELDAQVFLYNFYEIDPTAGGTYRVGENLDFYDWDEDSSNAVNFGKIRVPLKFTLESGKGYTLVLDISKAVIYENEGSKTGSAVNEPIIYGASITQ